ncbi:hypothetical protein UPYG_G00294330 [Umbra pygmaea]|uniref:Uncharacterized protein n=1 Tax=Umbra pygmaea TaxID=75934 RepID=A0ABD0WUQ9_UMBPY
MTFPSHSPTVVFLLTADMKTKPRKTQSETQRFAMVPYLLFRLLWVGAVVLPVFGTTERVTEPSVAGITKGWTESFTTGLDGYPTNQDLCEDEEVFPSNDMCTLISVNSSCVLYPTNQIECSWTLDNSFNEGQYYAKVFVCNGENDYKIDCLSKGEGQVVEGQRRDDVVEVNVSSKCNADDNTNKVILTLKVSRRDMWCLYVYAMEALEIEKLSPPPNITALVTGTDLLIQWGLPSSRWFTNSRCFIYELRINDQIRAFDNRLTYNETNVDPTQAYNVALRVRKSDDCRTSGMWSDWSNTIPLNASGSPIQLNYLGLVSILLGIPMILLTLTMIIRLQRDRLFPPIPVPPQKVKQLLEKDNLFQFFPQVLPSKSVEEITVVEESEKTPPNSEHEKLFQTLVE